MTNIHISTIAPLTIAGLFINTTCTDGAAKPAIKQLWRRVIKDKELEQLPYKVNNDLYAAYLFNHPTTPHIYTFVIGHAVSATENIAEPFGVFQINEGQYIHTETISGKTPDIIVENWPKLWAFAKENQLAFAYTADYEIYQEGDYLGRMSEEARVQIYASIK